MPHQDIHIDPVSHITTDAIGEPGSRIFYIQAWQGDQVTTLIIEKMQIQTLSIGTERFLAEISQRYPDLPLASEEYQEEQMHIHPPVDPLFRASELGLAYDNDRDMVVLLAREMLGEGVDPEEASVVQFWITRSQLLALSRWGIEVVARGRPICPYCGEPEEPEGHFCLKKNGHKH